VREITGLGLKEAKELCRGAAPKNVKEGVSKDEARRSKRPYDAGPLSKSNNFGQNIKKAVAYDSFFYVNKLPT
jgi:hypothetical protein